MKFQTPVEQELRQRLMLSPDFRYYVKMLGGDYEKLVVELLVGPPEQAEYRRGKAAALYLQLKDLGVFEEQK